MSLWEGPYKDGITSSMVSKFLSCRHRFYLKYMLGLQETKPFDAKLHYGSLFHDYLEGGEALLYKRNQAFHKQYTEHELIDYWTEIARRQVQLYEKHWKPWNRQNKVTVDGLEQSFSFEYELPCGRVVRVRGKIDGLVKLNGNPYVLETKTKGSIDVDKVSETLQQNFQAMCYCLASDRSNILYNVVRRPLGDKHAPRKRKKETDQEFLYRAFETYTTTSKSPTVYPIAKHLPEWFIRIKKRVSEEEMYLFQREIFVPLLTTVCNWWDDVSTMDDPFDSPHHFQTPFGLFNPLEFGWYGDYYDYLVHGKETNLETITTCFPELEEE